MPVSSEHDPPHNSELPQTGLESEMERLLLGADPLADLEGPFADGIRAWHSRLTPAAKDALSANDLMCLNGIITSLSGKLPK